MARCAVFEGWLCVLLRVFRIYLVIRTRSGTFGAFCLTSTSCAPHRRDSGHLSERRFCYSAWRGMVLYSLAGQRLETLIRFCCEESDPQWCEWVAYRRCSSHDWIRESVMESLRQSDSVDVLEAKFVSRGESVRRPSHLETHYVPSADVV